MNCYVSTRSVLAVVMLSHQVDKTFSELLFYSLFSLTSSSNMYKVSVHWNITCVTSVASLFNCLQLF